ncbi:MAG: O-antigen polymerase [Candidatus Marinimicrobia bacterium]|nr:O-antigen polymerase [Candidatus Neomarinimicrobiota bacterium]
MQKIYIHLPVGILLLVWISVFYLHYNNPYHFIKISDSTLQIIITGIFFLVLGYYFLNSFYLHDDHLPGDKGDIEINEAFWGKFILFISFFIAIGIFLVLIEISKITNGFKLYFENPFIVRETLVKMTEEFSPQISIFRYKAGSYLCSLMYPLSSMGGMMMAQKSRWRFTGLLPLILVVFYSIVHLNRFGLITSLCIWFFSMIYFGMYVSPLRRKVITRKTLLYISIAIIFVTVFFITIIRWRAFYVIDVEYLIRKSLYSYISGPVSAFEKFVLSDEPLLYGASSFRSVIRWLARVGLMNKNIALATHGDFINISRGEPMFLNTYTFVKALYQDFGLVGVGIISMIWGMLTRYLIERCFRQFRIINLFLVSIFILSFVMTFYEFYFEGLSVLIYWSIVVFVMEKYLHERSIVKYA